MEAEEEAPRHPLQEESLVLELTRQQRSKINFSGTHDPNYQTMAGVGGDAFGPDKKKAGGGGAPAGGGAGGPKAPADGNKIAGMNGSREL